MHYRNVRSPKECYYGYYPKNPSKPVALPAPADTSLYLLLTSITTSSSSVPVFSAPSLFYAPSQREATKAGVVPGKKWVLQESVGSFLSCTHRLVFCTVRQPMQTRSWCDGFSMESIPQNVCGSCTWDTSLRRVSEESSVMAACCVAAEPGRLRCVSCPQPPIVTGKVVTSSS